MTPSLEPKVKMVPVQKSFFDLDTFTDVTLRKEFAPKPEVTTVAEAAARLGNDTERLMEIINEGLVAEQRREEAANPSGWKVLTEDGTANGDFTGTPADSKIVNALRLNLAKTSVAPDLGLDWESATKEQKKTILEATTQLIKDTPIIRNGLKRTAALKIEDVETT